MLHRNAAKTRRLRSTIAATLARSRFYAFKSFDGSTPIGSQSVEVLRVRLVGTTLNFACSPRYTAGPVELSDYPDRSTIRYAAAWPGALAE
jgi:hypothetical protein